ncbi:unnamed protein product [Parascedosporium putredinis]|uniref:Ammonium-dependent carbamoyl phosphate synthetase n=1 Tax=Parascedosporium putredinis TaxID=1442378 RepID=A0A9P1GVM4_9PEZI|nr:unnamed protein product [Parascedosporium putredinis]CAI7987938.1 unnamed protein product [Parascedosporium putredinis]
MAAVRVAPPASARIFGVEDEGYMCLELEDGSAFQGYSFGAPKSIAGELVFATGMVGYTEGITDPSYRGQILVITFPEVGNYGVPSREAVDELFADLPAYIESARIHIAGLVTASYSGEDYSHFLAESSLGSWLKQEGIPAIYGVDTRSLTKRIRTQGALLGRLRFQNTALVNGTASSGRIEALSLDSFEEVEWSRPYETNIVAEVSIKAPKLYKPDPSAARKHPSGRTLRVLCLDVGMKYNQLRCLVRRGVEVLVCPWDHDIAQEAANGFDGLFISNGPGNPALLDATVKRVAKVMEENRVPIFGICLGHQLLARASGAETTKMKFGNRGANIPCTNMITGRCYITSQNHGYAVDATSLPETWKELFINANDGSNEGIMCTDRPYFSVQFHPESTPGPRDTEYLFNVFLDTVSQCAEDPTNLKKPVSFAEEAETENFWPETLPRGTRAQAIKALKEEGIYTVLINPNIATIQTSKGLADKVYFLPVNAEFVRKVILYERPDAIYVTFGGQTALSVGIQLKDEFEQLGVKVLGTPIDTIITTEDRELFARSMDSIGEKHWLPVIVRAAYALGGLGSGFANNEEELLDLCNKALAASPQVLIERSMKGWKEIEYEVVRDAEDNCITVCNMENFDPLGIHTGDSIVVAPSQTLSDEDYNMLRTTAVNVIRHLGVVGECNIQYALNPDSREYCIIEVNARLSRSSALASKATGYPLAFIAAKLGLGIPLKEISNSVTKSTCACFEPSLDYVVVKMPRWDLKKFTRVSTQLGSSMKSVGEVMSIGRTFEEAIQKAIRSIDFHNLGFGSTKALISIDDELQTPSDQRLFAIANAMYAGYSVEKIWSLTRIDKWFLHKLKRLSDFEKVMEKQTTSDIVKTPGVLLQAKRLGFSDRQLAKFWNSNEIAVRRLRQEAGIAPYVKQIDTVAAEFPAFTNYLYLTYNGSDHDVDFDDQGVMVLGSGVYRIGSSVEFDWCSVRAIRTLRSMGYKTVMVNYNPETVSTDYDEADKLYFENINLETVLDIYQLENSSGVLGAMGGQTPNNIALPLSRAGVRVLGTSPEMIDSAENRYKFSRMLDRIGVDQPTWKELTSFEEAKSFCQKVSYPVLVRPSYVLSGAAMNTVYSETDLENYLAQAAEVSREHPVVITKYIENAKEIEMDAVAKDGKVVCKYISEHVENAGVHSGDATLILPPQDLEQTTINRIVEATEKIGENLNVTGPFNIQFIAKDNDIKVIECNVRASRSFPFVSKVMGVDLIEIATKAIMGQPFVENPPSDLPPDCVGVKVPQFSFSRLSGADPVLGVEMASTGEVACFGVDKYEAYLKALMSTGFKIPKENILLSIGSYKDKKEMLPSVQKLQRLGYKLFATAGTADFLQEHGVPVQYLEVLGKSQDAQKSEFSLTQHLANNMIDLYINLPSSNRYRRPASYMSKGYQTRRMAVDYQIPLVTNVKNAKILIEAIARHFDLEVCKRDFQTSHRTVVLPGLVNVAAFVPGVVSPNNDDLQQITKASALAGFSMLRVAQQNTKAGAYCDFNFSVAATSNNADQISQVTGEVGSLFIPFNHLSCNISKVATVTAHFESWPQHKPIITDAKLTDLASILLLASLHDRRIHVSSVTTKEDIRLIALSKNKGLKDQRALWDHLSTIDVFAVGSLPYQLAASQGHKPDVSVGIAESLSLLLTSVADGRLTIDDVKTRLFDNPVEIFELHDQPGSSIEVEIDRPYQVSTDGATWSPFAGKTLKGSIQRVTFMGKTLSMDGELLETQPLGQDVSSHIPPSHTTAAALPMSPAVKPLQPFESPLDLAARRTSFLGPAQRPFARPIKGLDAAGPGSSPGLRPAAAFDELSTLAGQLHPHQHLHHASPLSELISQGSAFKRSHVLSVKQYSRSDLHLLFTVAQEMRLGVQREGVLNLLRGRVLCTLFYEPSTRTSASFDAAMQRLGGRTIAIATSQSSVNKGETLQDTLRTLGCYGDAIVLRHPEETSADIAQKYSSVPVINGGNGSKEHPTQAFLDLFTIREERGTVEGLTITFVGDLLYGRPVHSLVYLLRHYHVRIQLVAPRGLSLPAEIREQLVADGRLLRESEVLTEEILADSDVLYCTRIQKERFPSVEDYNKVKGSYRIDNATLKHAKPETVVMHPLPRNDEVAEEVDFDQQRAAYFRQMRYGLYCRMALWLWS